MGCVPAITLMNNKFTLDMKEVIPYPSSLV